MAIRIRRDSWQSDRQFDEVQNIASEVTRITNIAQIVLAENMTTTQKNAIVNPGAGRIVFDTTLDKLCMYTGSAWETITSV